MRYIRPFLLVALLVSIPIISAAVSKNTTKQSLLSQAPSSEQMSSTPVNKKIPSFKQRQQFIDTLKNAQKVSSVQINNCKASPPVAQIKYRENLTIKNADAISHTITFNNTHSLTLAANTTQTIKADFGGGAIVFGYTCDAKTQTAGTIVVLD